MNSTTSAKVRKKRFSVRQALKILVSDEDWRKFRKPVISAFLLFHMSLNVVYMFNVHPYEQGILRFFWSYYAYMGLDQDFGVFAPSPRSVNPHLVALITYTDGTTKLWMNPRMERLDYFTRIQKERYRKFFDDNTAWSNMQSVWPDLTAHIARINYDDPANPPKTVTLMRFSSEMPRPEKGLTKKNPPHFQRTTMQPYVVRPEDLR